MKRKVIFFSNTMNMGGMEKALIILLNSLDENKFEITLYLEKKEGILLKEINANIVIKALQTSNNRNVILRKVYNFVNRIIWVLKNKNKYDFSCNYSTYFVLGSKLALAASKNTLLYVHSDYFNLYKKNIIKINKFFNKINAFKFRKIAFVSNQAKENLIGIYPEHEDKFVVLNNLFDYESVLKQAKKKVTYKKKANHKLLIFIGRLEEESKNIIRLLDIMLELKKYNVDLVMIGGGPDQLIYKQIINQKKLTNVVMLGEKENPYPYLSLADALILTSRYEGYPIVFSEAIVLGKPIISSLKVSDKYLNISDKYALFIGQTKNSSEKILTYLNKNHNLHKIDFKTINKNRLKDIVNVINGR